MPVIGGISGNAVIDSAVVQSFRRWSIDTATDSPSFSHGSLKKGTGTTKGPQRWSGSFEAYGPLPQLVAGADFTFHGSFDGVNGCSGPAKVSGVDIVWDKEGKKPIGHVVSFVCDGTALTRGAEAGDEDDTARKHYTSADAKFTYITTAPNTPVSTDLSNVRTMNFKMSVPMSAYNSGTVEGNVVGPLAATVSVAAYIDDMAALPTEGDVYTLKLYTTATLFWEIKYARYNGLSGLIVDRETGAVIGGTLNWTFDGQAEIGTSPPTTTIGSIKTPEAVPTTIWPV